ncbi:MAG: hypothetical protein Q7T85_09765 [Nitrosomonas sp.]|nr:hypothetical protein [Nitrosomonas sp.]
MDRRTFHCLFPVSPEPTTEIPQSEYLGTHVTLQELGINIEFYSGGDAEVLLKASIDPGNFDIYAQWSDSIKILWMANAIQPIDIKKLKYLDEINGLSKIGQLTDQALIGLGAAPHKILYYQSDGSLGPTVSNYISFLPYEHSTDS